MGVGMTALNIAGKGLEIAGGVSEGIQRKTQSQIEAAKLKFAADVGKVRAQETDAAYREDLEQTMQTISAIRASQNVRFDSPTATALYDKADEVSDRARVTAVANEKMKALGYEGDSAAVRAGGKMARTTALLKSAKTIGSLAQDLYGVGKSIYERE
jgi:hypothetical protein